METSCWAPYVAAVRVLRCSLATRRTDLDLDRTGTLLDGAPRIGGDRERQRAAPGRAGGLRGHPRRGSAAVVAGRRRGAHRGGHAGRIPAAGVRRRVRPAARPDGLGCPRRGVRPPGRRLRRDVRGGDGRQHPRPHQDHPPDGRRAHLRRLGPGRQGRPDGRPVRQAAQHRNRDPRWARAAAYRGDMVNDFAFEAVARTPDPNRLVRAYRLVGHPEPRARVHHGRLRRPAPRPAAGTRASSPTPRTRSTRSSRTTSTWR